MTIKIQTADGRPIEHGISAILKRVVDALNRNFSKVSSESMTKCVQDWISTKYPNSKHWDPKKVNPGKSNGLTGTTVVDIPGAGRAYHDVVIKPIRARALTIPIHASAFGKKASDFNDLFKPKGKNILARNENGQLVAMFALAKSAFQKKDPSLMPPDERLAGDVFSALATKLKI